MYDFVPGVLCFAYRCRLYRLKVHTVANSKNVSLLHSRSEYTFPFSTEWYKPTWIQYSPLVGDVDTLTRVVVSRLRSEVDRLDLIARTTTLEMEVRRLEQLLAHDRESRFETLIASWRHRNTMDRKVMIALG